MFDIKVIVIAAYALMIIIIGIMGLKKTTSFKDFFLGGGNVGPWMTAFTYGTAYFSAVLFIGFAGKIGWNFGYSGLWVAVGNAIVGVFGVWWLLGNRIKKMSVEYNVSTMSEYLEKRYNSKFLKIFGSASIFIFFIPYTAAVFIGLSYLFESSFNFISYNQALIFMGCFTAIYLVLGGYKSMTMIDVVFGMIMCVGVCILLWFTIDKANGLSNLTEGIAANGKNPKLTDWIGPPGVWPLFCLVFLTSVAPFAMPQLVQKFYAIKDERSVKIGMFASTCFALLIGGVAYFAGATTRFHLTPETAPNVVKIVTASNGVEKIVAEADKLMPELLSNIIPESLSVVILLLILSASMSTLAALVLISSSAVAKDVYAGFINKNASDKSLTMLMRISSVLFVLLSVVLAFFKPAGIVTILAISWGAIGAVFLGPFIWGLFTKKANKYGAIASAVLGLSVCILWYVYKDYDRRFVPEAGTIGMLASLIINPIVSAITPNQESAQITNSE